MHQDNPHEGYGCSITTLILFHHCHKHISLLPCENILPLHAIVGLIARASTSLFWYLWIVALGDWTLFSVCVCVCVVTDGTLSFISKWPGTPLCLIWAQNRTHLQAEYWACEHSCTLFTLTHTHLNSYANVKRMKVMFASGKAFRKCTRDWVF